LPLERLENEMNELMGRFFGREEGWGWGDGLEKLEAFTPRMNLVETENAYEVTVELPGIKPEEFNVEFKEGALWITGHRKEEKEEKGKTFHRVERHFGEFRRMIPLPGAVNEEKVEAAFKEGLLTVTVPKAEIVKPRHIAVKT
jgi:HSP20 family protein